MLKRTIAFMFLAAAMSACGGGELGSITVGEEAPVFKLVNLLLPPSLDLFLREAILGMILNAERDLVLEPR